jgi:hypothetical protein
MSVDPENPTDLELDSFDDPASSFGLRAVEDELDEAYENELAGYEDEDDGDDMSHFSSSSFDSEELNHSIQWRVVGPPPSPTTPTIGIYKALPPAPMPYMLPSHHFYQSSLSMNWTFPKGPGTTESVDKANKEEGIDRFFDCLDDNESEASDSIPSSFSYEKSKGLFASGFALAPEEDEAAFFLPSGVGVPIPEELAQKRVQLESVTEEEEEEEEEKEQSDFEDDSAMFGDIGGIKITFTPPQEEEEEREQIQLSSPKPKRVSPPPTLPALNFGDDNEDDPFSFGHERTLPYAEKSALVSSPHPPPAPAVKPSPSPVPMTVSSSPPVSVAVLPTSSPFSLSRSTSRRTSLSMIPRVVSPPVSSRVTSPGPAARPSSTRKSGSPTPSIPQLLTRHTPTPPPKPKTAPTSTFIRQPSVRKTFAKAENVTARSSPNENGSTVSAVIRRFY